MQTTTNNINKTRVLVQKKLEVKTNRTSCLCGNGNGHHNTVRHDMFFFACS